MHVTPYHWGVFEREVQGTNPHSYTVSVQRGHHIHCVSTKRSPWLYTFTRFSNFSEFSDQMFSPYIYRVWGPNYFLLIFTEFEHYEVIVQSVSELQEGPAVGIATCSLLKPTPTCKTNVDFFRLSADGESEFKLNGYYNILYDICTISLYNLLCDISMWYLYDIWYLCDIWMLSVKYFVLYFVWYISVN